MSFSRNAGNWSITFASESSELVLTNGDKVAIKLSSSVVIKDQQWRLVPPMDAVSGRLALVAPDGNVQGYLTFAGNGGRLEIRAIHRTAQFYHGILSFEGSVSFPGAFACRCQPPEVVNVIQMGTGMTDSKCNDALFDREHDRCLVFSGANQLEITTVDADNFNLKFQLVIQKAAQAAIVLELHDDYYKDRYIPYYEPINKKRCPSPPTGWMSWNVYFDQAGAKENLDEARIGARELKPFGMEFWSIESWQGNSDSLPVSKFDNLNLTAHKGQFPEGMGKLAKDIREIGFRPGIWTAPFGTGSDEFYQEHKDWFLHDENGTPMKTWNGKYTIDPSNDEVIEYLKQYHRHASQEWGYEFFKIDGMSGRSHGYCAHFFERPEVRARFKDPTCPNPFERCAAAFREGIGPDRVFLACQGHYTGPEAGVGDASRIGGDIVAPNTDSNWNNVLSQARATLNQLFVHNIVFYMDPDTLLVGDYHPLEEARVTATVVALPGQMMFAGDKLATLSAERMMLLKQSLPVCDVHPMNLYPVFDMAPIWDLKVKRDFANWDVVALFNWSDNNAEIGFSFEELGLEEDKSYLIYEYWTKEFQDIFETNFSMIVPAHGVRLLAIHEDLGRPQFLSSSRHITQGAVDLKALEWDAKKQNLTGSVELVANHPTTLTFYIGEEHTLQRVAVPGVDMALKLDNTDGILQVTLTAAKNQLADFTIKVEKKG